MVSAMIATTASVSPSCQDTRIENATRMTTATMARNCQIRILGLADRWARLPRRGPVPRDSSASSTGVTTGFHSGFGGSARSTAGSAAGIARTERSPGGDQSHKGRSADSGSAATGSRPVASRPVASAAVSSGPSPAAAVSSVSAAVSSAAVPW